MRLARAIEDKLLPQRALMALSGFQAADRGCAGDAGAGVCGEAEQRIVDEPATLPCR